MNRSILHPTRKDLHDNVKVNNGHKTVSQFYYENCKVGYLYEKWMNLFIDNGMLFDDVPYIIKFDGSHVYTPFTYKFCFNFPNSDGVFGGGYTIKSSDYQLIAELFLTENWIREFKESGSDYVNKNVKPWVDYVTFQGSRIIVQFRFDFYLRSEARKEKLEKLNTI